MHKRWFCSCALALACLHGLAPAQVIVHSTRGNRARGERILPGGDDAYRLEVYRGQTAPLIEHYRVKGLLQSVDAAGTVETIAERIGALLT